MLCRRGQLPGSVLNCANQASHSHREQRCEDSQHRFKSGRFSARGSSVSAVKLKDGISRNSEDDNNDPDDQSEWLCSITMSRKPRSVIEASDMDDNPEHIGLCSMADGREDYYSIEVASLLAQKASLSSLRRSLGCSGDQE